MAIKPNQASTYYIKDFQTAIVQVFAANTYVKSQLANTNSFIKAQLANTNSFIGTKEAQSEANSRLANTNLFIAQKMSVANTNTIKNNILANTNSFIKSQLANTNLFIATKMSVANTNTIKNNILANTNSFIKSQLANTNTFIATKTNTTTFNSALANTNLFIAQKISVANNKVILANTNSFIKAQLANTNTFIATKTSTTTFNSALANTNSFIKSQLANTNTFIGTKTNTTTFNSALANTNTYIGTKTNTTTFNSGLANTNTYIASKPKFNANTSAPSSPNFGDQYFDLINNINFTWITDGLTGIWAEIGPQGITDMADLFKFLSADDTGGQNALSAQPWFPTAGAVTVAGATSYRFMGFLHLTRSAGTTSHTTGLLFAGTASLTSIRGIAITNSGVDVSTDSASHFTLISVGTNTTVKAASTSATEEAVIFYTGIIRINAAGTLIPQFIYSAAPGGTPTIKANSFWYMTPIGTNTVTTQGTWA